MSKCHPLELRDFRLCAARTEATSTTTWIESSSIKAMCRSQHEAFSFLPKMLRIFEFWNDSKRIRHVTSCHCCLMFLDLQALGGSLCDAVSYCSPGTDCTDTSGWNRAGCVDFFTYRSPNLKPRSPATLCNWKCFSGRKWLQKHLWTSIEATKLSG